MDCNKKKTLLRITSSKTQHWLTSVWPLAKIQQLFCPFSHRNGSGNLYSHGTIDKTPRGTWSSPQSACRLEGQTPRLFYGPLSTWLQLDCWIHLIQGLFVKSNFMDNECQHKILAFNSFFTKVSLSVSKTFIVEMFLIVAIYEAPVITVPVRM